jgi:hypothetical protein
MGNPSDVRRISLPFRVAAWVLFLGSAVVLVDLLAHIPNLRVERRADAVFSGVAGIFGLFMFGYIALTGRSPGLLLLLEDTWNSRLGIKPCFNPASRFQLLCWIVAVVTGAGLIAAADASELFGEEIRGLVLLIYSIAAVALVALVWRLARLPPNKSLERTREE